jgi:hypothetical protein
VGARSSQPPKVLIWPLGMEIAPRGVLKLAVPLLRRRVRADFERDARNIKVILEGEGGTSPSPPIP